MRQIVTTLFLFISLLVFLLFLMFRMNT